MYMKEDQLIRYQHHFYDRHFLRPDEIEDVAILMSDMIEDEVKAMLEKEPYATKTAERMRSCARELVSFIEDVEWKG